MSENAQFYYNVNGNNAGPVSAEELVNLAKQGEINRDTLVWRQGYEDWKKLSESEIDVSFLPPPIKAAPQPVAAQTPPPMRFNQAYAGQTQMAASGENVFMYYINAFKQYVTFQGRARRKEYWFFTLFHLLAFILLVIIENAVGATYNIYLDYYTVYPIGILSSIYLIASALPQLAVTVRRLHDTGKSGWLYLLMFIPIIGAIVILVFTCMDSQFGANQYGENPKGLN